MSKAQSLYDAGMCNCPRSPEWKAGALRGLQKALGEDPAKPRSPYACGTAQDDAWRAGIQHGLSEGRAQA